MEQVIDPTKDLIDILIQVLIVIIPVVLTWIIRTYVRGSRAEKDLEAIVNLSNSAIDYVENLDKRDVLELDPDVSKGIQKLNLAAQWFESELRRAGIKMKDEEAEQWISSEFQKRVGEVRMFGAITALADRAVGLVRYLHLKNDLQIPEDAEQTTYLVEIAADWFLAQLAAETGAAIPREEALIWVRAAYVQSLQSQPGGHVAEIPTDDPLVNLAQRAVTFVEQLKASGQLTPQTGTTGEQFEVDVAVAWATTDAARQGLTASKDQITEAVKAVFYQRHGEME